MQKHLLTIILLLSIVARSHAQWVADKKLPSYFALDKPMIYVDDSDLPLVKRAALWLQGDMEKVTGVKPAITGQWPSFKGDLIVIGSSARSAGIGRLVKEGQFSMGMVNSKWEAYHVQIITTNKGQHIIVIGGSDRRGTAYGVLELSKQLGVSPWYWWADVPVVKKKAVYIKTDLNVIDSPRVKYRGIFINDEAPAFAGWAKEKFGGINHQVYEKVFELILRLKGNYLWPAMWSNAFNDDDPLDPVLADEYGIVMGTSHHEPMLRAQQEWKRYGAGPWDYDSNEVRLKAFWKKGIENMGNHESIVTIGMRGDGDMPMTEGTATALLERIVTDQRTIIANATHRPAEQTPQLWALYKEVQDYYDKGMRVPDDVTLLLCDDNWGNIRKLPKLGEKPRPGGYGIYYHFDYVGGPRNYKWINTNNIARVWEQMHLAYAYNAKQIWIVNVGDIKPMEFPITFFLDHAWNPDQWNADNVNDYYIQWATAQFGGKYATAIAAIMREYAQMAAARKPELLSPQTYSLDHYGEADMVEAQWNRLTVKAESIERALPEVYHDAFFELVLHPVLALSTVTKMYIAAARNAAYAKAGSSAANVYAEQVKQLFIQDSLISLRYNKQTANGKWDHMMDQTHIGYTYWQQPLVNKMPEVQYVNPGVKETVPVAAVPNTRAMPLVNPGPGHSFYEKDGYISINAEDHTNAVNGPGLRWTTIPGIGRNAGGVTIFPVTALSPRLQLQYEVDVYDTGTVKIQALFSPTLNFHHDGGLRYGISVDDEPVSWIPINKEDNDVKVWGGWVANNIINSVSTHHFSTKGRHTIKYSIADPGIILQKIIVDLGGLQQSYFGPPETISN